MKKPLATLLLTLALAAAAPATAGAVAPTILTTGVSGATTESVVLEAQINPQGKATKYHFEYGPGDCASSPCESTPELQIPSGEAAVPVSATVTGLTPGATYHFRAVAVHKNETGGEVVSPDRTFAPYLEPQQFSGCPNESLRTANPAAARIEGSDALLPDCRAWEQVTPVDKDGGDATDTTLFARAAADGGAFSFLSVSGVPGGVGSQEIPDYVARRGAEGWSTQGVLPPAGTGQVAKVLGWTPDLTDIFSSATRLGAGESTALLGGPGTPQTVAPYLHSLSPKFVGSTADGALVFFESKVAIPGVVGALEGEPNVYVWEKAGGTIRLADSLDDETAPSLGAHAGSYDWVHGVNPKSLGEGGAEGHYYTADQHAFAADGSALYFTDASNGRLYERLNPAALQSPLDGTGRCTVPADACTIAVSATQRTSPGPDPAGSAPAAFQAASADGTKAFFTSSEMLTDDADTGPEQEPPAVVGAGLATGEGRAQCVPTHAQAVAVDSEHVYWIDLRTGAIGRAGIDCDPGTVESDFLTPAQLEIKPGLAANPRGLAVQGGFLYWAAAAGEKGEGAIGRAKLNGPAAASEVTPEFIKDAGNPEGVATDAEHVYWTDSATSNTDEAFIGKAKLNGSNAAEDVEPKLVEIGSSERHLTGIAVDSEYIYWMDTSFGAHPEPSFISRARLDGSKYNESPGENVVFIFVGPDAGGQGLAVQGNHIYWAAQGFDEIGRAQLNGEAAASAVEPEFVKNAGNPKGLAVDGSSIYWTAHAEAAPNPGKDLYRYDTTSGTLTDLAPDHTGEDGAQVRGVLGVSADGSYVYFAADGVPDGVTGSPNARGESAEPGDCAEAPSSSTRATCNLYLSHEGEVRFVARLETGGDEPDSADWAPTSAAFNIFPTEMTARVSADGRALLFRSQRRLTAYDNEGVPELYLYRVGSGVSCVSCNPTGEAAGLAPQLGVITPTQLVPGPPASTLSRNLSVDGRRVFFETTEALVVEDTNGDAGCPPVGTLLQALVFRACADTYEWETPGTGSCTAARAVDQGGCIYLLSTGTGTEPALIGDASGEGEDVFFFSRQRLVGQDEDSLEDVYDAREDGGLASQNAAAPPLPCEGEACKGPASSPPVQPAPATGSFVGAPNPKPAVKKHKKHHHKKKHNHTRGRHHGGNGRAGGGSRAK